MLYLKRLTGAANPQSPGEMDVEYGTIPNRPNPTTPHRASIFMRHPDREFQQYLRVDVTTRGGCELFLMGPRVLTQVERCVNRYDAPFGSHTTV